MSYFSSIVCMFGIQTLMFWT